MTKNNNLEAVFINGKEDFQKTMVHELYEVLVVILVDEKISHSPMPLNTKVSPGLHKKKNYISLPRKLNDNVHVCTGVI